MNKRLDICILIKNIPYNLIKNNNKIYNYTIKCKVIGDQSQGTKIYLKKVASEKWHLKMTPKIIKIFVNTTIFSKVYTKLVLFIE